MILILSHSMDFSTTHIMRNLMLLNKGAYRINSIDISKDNVDIIINNESYNMYIFGRNVSHFSKVYIRRNYSLKYDIKFDEISSKELLRFLDREYLEFKRFLYESISKLCSNIIGLTSYNYIEDNKLLNLKRAIISGFSIPPTIVTTSKDELLNFFKKYEAVILKPLKSVEILTDYKDNIDYTMYNVLLKIEDFDNLQNNIFPLFAQQFIKKSLEIRIFFWGERIWTACILSQIEEKGKIDFRANSGKLNIIPFNLPDNIRKCIIEFIRLSDLKTGSIDLILSENEEFYFLEVNSAGQFEFISDACNFNISRDIATML